MARYFIDTNLIVYANDRRDLNKQSRALEVLKQLMSVGNGALSVQVLQEYANTALAKLDQEKLQQAQMVSVSTTLATNAIVEGEGQKVGMIILPPYGLFEPEDIPYEPKAVISGRLEITGKEISPVDEAEVKRVVRRMVAQNKVKAFAGSCYAGAINPAHELKVKRIIPKCSSLPQFRDWDYSMCQALSQTF